MSPKSKAKDGAKQAVEDDVLVAEVKSLLSGDLEGLSVKKVVGLLEEKFKCELQDKKELIKETINKILAEKESASEGEEEEEEEEEKPAKKAKKDNGKSAASPRGRKTVCSIGRDTFLKKAPNLKLTLDLGDAGSQELLGKARTFSSGSFGYFVNGKFKVDVAGEEVMLQVGCNVTVVGSKNMED
eukprot:GGOE01061101.1.p1 GENE.GGOE01061101.1~~GGOE01061101.1.p1  ORF type:complete len:194 (+),score=78.77 GGOE01061101.1:30-584(+)